MKIGPALFAVLAAMAVAAGAPNAPGVPDVIYIHGKIVTVDKAFHLRQAFAVRGDRFIAVGSNAQIRALAGKSTRLVDLGGATVIPGLSDGHDHLWNSGKYLFRGVDMVGVTSRDVMLDRLRTAVRRARPGEVVYTTTGWKVQPDLRRADLDRISATIPIVAIAYRRGSGMLNSAALRRLTISKTHPAFRGTPVPVDESGEPTGAPPRYPAGMFMIDALLPPLTPALEDQLVQQQMKERNALGITSVRELAVMPDAVRALERMNREGKLTVRMAIGMEFSDSGQTKAHLAVLPRVKRDDPWLFLDCVGEEPWTPGTTSLEDFTELVREENRLGWRPAPHVNGDLQDGTADAATEATLTAYEAADRDSSLLGKRWYLEHVPFSTPAQIERMARLGLVVSVQDAGYVPAPGAPRFQMRMAHQNPIRELLDHKVIVISGSDYLAPGVTGKDSNNPMTRFYFYVTRRTSTGAIDTPSEKISREDALRLFTANPAYATFQEKIKGQIAPGMLADFVVLNHDLLQVPDDQIASTKPLATFVGGRKVYAAPGAEF